MNRVLIFCAGEQGAQESLQIEEAIEQHNKGNEVHFLYCDDSIGGCNNNPNFDKRRCYVCKLLQRKNRKTYLPSEINTYSVKSLITNEILEIARKKFKYQTTEELRKLKFHGVEIGLGAISSYITFTRNLDPLINEESKRYFDRILASQVLLTLIIEKLDSQNKFDKIIVHNGRFAIFKPFLNFAQTNGIDYICTESFCDSKGNVSKDYYYNDIPHNINPRHKKYLIAWDEALKYGIDRESISKSFFERRRNAEGTGDKIYTANQEKDKLVNNWDDSKENIVIYNSSEDEFCAVSGDFENKKLFSNQMNGIKTIVEHYRNDNSKHFYLRVHPNLIPVKYAYHLDLYKLNYPNLTVIHADSRISSYALLDKADKVITFGSTMGIEATYAKKPSICIGASFYEQLNVVYQPRNIDEIWRYIDDKQLTNLYSNNVLIYGYYLMGIYNSIIQNKFKHIDARILKYKIFGQYRLVRAYEKILNSNKLFLFVRYLLNLLENSKIPMDENSIMCK